MQPNPSGLAADRGGPNRQPDNPQRILFVDDERYVLDGLRDALRAYRRRWAMSFVSSGEDALAALEDQPHDIVVSDLRMPGMDGATLLARVRELHPTTVRIVLSGQAELRMVARAAGVAHRLLSKPCEIDELARVLERSCALHEIAGRVELSRRLAGASALPSVPRLYLELSELLRGGETGAEDAARIIERDIAMAAKVLQLANSAYFGRRYPVSHVRDAVAYLGLEALRALVLSAETFRQFPLEAPIEGFDLDELHLHCSRVARLARTIGGERADAEESFAAGLLHDVGLLMIASQEGEELAAALATARTAGRPLHEVERDRYGVTHAEVGAHLLALWGLPHPVIEAVAHHHTHPPQDAPLDSTVATYLANALIGELEPGRAGSFASAGGTDQDYLERSGLTTQLARWRELAERQLDEEAEQP